MPITSRDKKERDQFHSDYCGRVVERRFAWLVRFRRLAIDCEALALSLKGMYLAAFAFGMLPYLASLPGSA